MEATGTAKRYCTSRKRKIRWDRILTCALIPVITVLGVHSIANAYKNKCVSDAAGKSDYVEAYNGTVDEYECINITQVPSEEATTETHTTTTIKRKQIVVDEHNAGWKLKLKSSASSMMIDGEYFSSKLKNNVSVRELQILMMLVLSEGAWETHDAQVSIAATVLNRVQYQKMFPDTIEKVVVEPSQFSPVIMKNPERNFPKGLNGFYINSGKTEVHWEDYPKSVQESVRKAVYEALDGTDPTDCIGGALYYCNMNVLEHEEKIYRSDIGETITLGKTTFYREW